MKRALKYVVKGFTMQRVVYGVLGIALASLITIAMVKVLQDARMQPKPRFKTGQIVQVKLTGERVMVRRVLNFAVDSYWCRVGSRIQQRRDGLLSRDSEITRYSVIRFYDYELMPLEEPRGGE